MVQGLSLIIASMTIFAGISASAAPLCEVMFSSVVELTGSARGDANEREIYRSQNAQSPSTRARIVFDPAYDSKQNSLADYESSTHTITLGRKALQYGLEGSQTPLRHELQHHVEQLKIERGEFSLRRLTFAKIENAQMGVETRDGYEKFLTFDELETYLGDLKALRKSKADKKIAGAVAKLLEQLIVQANRSIDALNEKLSSGKFEQGEFAMLMRSPWAPPVDPAHPPMNTVYLFKIGKDEFVNLALSLRGSYPLKPRRNQISQWLRETINQTFDRIDAIESELKRIEAELDL